MDLKEFLLAAINCSIEAGKEILEIYNNSNFEIEFKTDNSPLTIADKTSNSIIVNHLKKFNIPILSEEGKETHFYERKNWKYYWLIDPLDGTKEFIKKNDEFTVNIALLRNNQPILGVIYTPVLKDLYFASEKLGSFKINIDETMSSLNDFVQNAHQLPLHENNTNVVVASRSHLSEETQQFIDILKQQTDKLMSISKGSSLKLCLVAEGNADLYPRFAPTMEWDIAAGHAIVIYSGGNIFQYPGKKDIEYNKENLLNPWFLVISRNNKFIIS